MTRTVKKANAGIKTPDGSPMDYKVKKLTVKKPELEAKPAVGSKRKITAKKPGRK